MLRVVAVIPEKLKIFLIVRNCGENVLLSSFKGILVQIWVFTCKIGGNRKAFYVPMLWENRFFFKEFNFLLKEPKRVFLEIFYLKASIV